MSDLNSIILEGTINNVPTYIEHSATDGRELLRFVLKSVRKETYGEESRTTILFIQVIVTGNLAFTMKELLHDGKRIRIVGRLTPGSGYSMPSCILAEHIEIQGE